MNSNIFFSFAAIVVISGCATSGGPRQLSYEEASAFENSLRERSTQLPTYGDFFTQPVNKAEPCKLPSSKDQMERPNFRAYWDGDCRNGFAFGIGRDIAMSDTHHYEEITIHDGTGDNWSNPSVFFDFVNNLVRYRVGGEKFPAHAQLQEQFIQSYDGLSVEQTIAVADEYGNVSIVNSWPFDTQRHYRSTDVHRNYELRFSDNTAAPVVGHNSQVFVVEFIDPHSNAKGGVAIARFANGQVGHFKIVNGEPVEKVVLPAEYVSHIENVYQSVRNNTASAASRLQTAQQIEREYLYRVCNGQGSIVGLSQDAYTKVCTWRDQFKTSYALASERFQKQLESMRAQAATADQQRQAQQQIALQQDMLQQQQSQQAWNQLSQTTQQLRQTSQQILQNVMSWQAPQVQPLTRPGQNRFVCRTIGSITTCN